MKKELKLSACDENLAEVLEQTELMLTVIGCDETTKMQIMVAAEEIFVNISHYAYDGKPGEVVITMEIVQEPLRFRMSFCDGGIPYNPLEHEDPDITLSAEERAVGGLGIYIVRQTMDELRYEYCDGRNELTLEKKLTE